jgi:hypothetical protein
VTDLSSLTEQSSSSCGYDSPALPSTLPVAARTVSPAPSRPLPPLRCAVCGRPGVTAVFWLLFHLLWRRSGLANPDGDP